MSKMPQRRDDLLVEQIKDETLVYDRSSSQAHYLSAPAAAVFAACDGGTSRQDIEKALGADVVEAGLAELGDSGLLVGIDRRRVIRAAAIGAVALPLITSVAVPRAAAATSFTGGGTGGGGGTPATSGTVVALGSDGWTTRQLASGDDGSNTYYNGYYGYRPGVAPGATEEDPNYYQAVEPGSSPTGAPINIPELTDAVLQRTVTVTGPTTLSFQVFADDAGEAYLFDTATNTVALHIPGDLANDNGGHGATDVAGGATYAVPAGTHTYLFSARGRNDYGDSYLDASITATP